MKNCLRATDFFGQRFNFYIGYRPKYYSYFGGIITLIAFVSYILTFVFLGYDDLKRKNPISNTSTSPPSGYKNIKFGEEKIYLPWRIIDYDENPINITGKIYPKIFYFTVHPDNVTGELITKYNLVDYKLCNETSMKNLGKEYIIDIPLETLYCIDMENLKVGGSWNSDFINFIRFDLYMCKDGIDYDESNVECTSYENLENIYGGGESIFFELLYPIIQFQPTNLEVPILIVYKTHYYIINKYSNKLDRLYLQEYFFQDEKSWLINHPKNISYWGVNSMDGESYIKSNRDVLRFASTSKCYTLNIYFELGNIFFTRKYKKIYEILGEVFPVINVLYIIFEFVARKLNEAHAAKKLNEYIMGYENNMDRKNLIEIKNQNQERKSKTKKVEDISSNKNNSKILICKNKTHNIKEAQSNKLISSSFEDASKMVMFNSNLNNDNGNMNVLTKIVPKNNQEKFNKQIYQISENRSQTINKRSIDKYPLKFYFYGMIHMKLNYANTLKSKNRFFGVSPNFVKSFAYFRNIIDVTTYIRLVKEFELYKKLTMMKNESGKIERSFDRGKGSISVRNSQIVNNYLY